MLIYFKHFMVTFAVLWNFHVFRCASSSLNGEELVRDGGVNLLATLLSRCMCVVQPTTLGNEPSAVIVTNIMRTFSVLSKFEAARAEMLGFSGLVQDIVHCTELELAPSAVDAALQTIANVSVSSELQDALLEAGVLWYVSIIVLLKAAVNITNLVVSTLIQIIHSFNYRETILRTPMHCND